MAGCWWAAVCQRLDQLTDSCRNRLCGSLFQTKCCIKCRPQFEDFADEDFKVGQKSADANSSNTEISKKNDHDEDTRVCSQKCAICCDVRSWLPGKVFRRRKLSLREYSVTYKHFSDYNDAALFPKDSNDTSSITTEATNRVNINICSHVTADDQLKLNAAEHYSPNSMQAKVVIHTTDSLESISLDGNDQQSDIQLPYHPDLPQFNSMKDYLRKKSLELSMTSSYAGDSIGSCQWSHQSPQDSVNSLQSYPMSSSSGSVNEELDKTENNSKFFDNKDRHLIKVAKMLGSEEFLHIFDESSDSSDQDVDECDTSSDQDVDENKGHQVKQKTTRTRRQMGERNHFRISYSDTCDNGIQILVTDYDPEGSCAESLSDTDYVFVCHKDEKTTTENTCKQMSNSSEQGSVTFGLNSDDESDPLSQTHRKVSETLSSDSENVFIKTKYKQTSV